MARPDVNQRAGEEAPGMWVGRRQWPANPLHFQQIRAVFWRDMAMMLGSTQLLLIAALIYHAATK